MSLDLYHCVKKDHEIAGCRMPELQSAVFCSAAETVKWPEVLEAISQLKPLHGWYMKSDEIVADCQLPPAQNVIEGEWANAEQTLKVKLLHGDDYLLTTMSAVNDDGLEKVYRVQEIVLRHDLWLDKARNVALYRYWWAQSDEENQGLWVPYAQQFIGYGWNGKALKEPRENKQNKEANA